MESTHGCLCATSEEFGSSRSSDMREPADRGIHWRAIGSRDRYRGAGRQFRLLIVALLPHFPPNLRHHSAWLCDAPPVDIGTGFADRNGSLPCGSRVKGG